MDRSQSAEAIAGRATGALFFIGFGSLWLSTGLSALHRLNSVSAGGVAVIALALAIPAVGILRRAGKASQLATSAAEQAKVLARFSHSQYHPVEWSGRRGYPFDHFSSAAIHRAGNCDDRGFAPLPAGARVPLPPTLRHRRAAAVMVGRSSAGAAPGEAAFGGGAGDGCHSAGERRLYADHCHPRHTVIYSRRY